MTHSPIVEILFHMIIPVALVIPLVYAYKIYKDVYGVLNSLWKPFEVIMIGIVPIAIVEVLYAIEILSDLTIIPLAYSHPIEHLVIIFSFVMIAYGFHLIRDTLNDYGALVKKVRRGERIK